MLSDNYKTNGSNIDHSHDQTNMSLRNTRLLRAQMKAQRERENDFEMLFPGISC